MWGTELTLSWFLREVEEMGHHCNWEETVSAEPKDFHLSKNHTRQGETGKKDLRLLQSEIELNSAGEIVRAVCVVAGEEGASSATCVWWLISPRGKGSSQEIVSKFGARCPRKLGSHSPTETRKLRCCLPRGLYFKGMVPSPWRKTFPGSQNW